MSPLNLLAAARRLSIGIAVRRTAALLLVSHLAATHIPMAPMFHHALASFGVTPEPLLRAVFRRLAVLAIAPGVSADPPLLSMFWATSVVRPNVATFAAAIPRPVHFESPALLARLPHFRTPILAVLLS
jgi:hypothetical protein